MQKALKSLQGVDSVKVDFKKKTATVKVKAGGPTDAMLVSVINSKTKFKCKVYSKARTVTLILTGDLDKKSVKALKSALSAVKGVDKVKVNAKEKTVALKLKAGGPSNSELIAAVVGKTELEAKVMPRTVTLALTGMT